MFSEKQNLGEVKTKKNLLRVMQNLLFEILSTDGRISNNFKRISVSGLLAWSL